MRHVPELARTLCAALVLTGAAQARAFVRTTTGPGDPAPSACVWWGQRQVPFAVNAQGSRSTGCVSSEASVALARASFAAWGNATRAGAAQPCTDFAFVDRGTTTRIDVGYDPCGDNVNLVVWRRGVCERVLPQSDPCFSDDTCANKHGCWAETRPDGEFAGSQVIALTTTTFRTSTGEILDADMELHDWNGSVTAPTGHYFTCADPGSGVCATPPYGRTGCISADVGNVVTHEAGHMLGLDHTNVAAATMYPTEPPGETSKRSLASDDVEGVCTIYPRGQATSICVSATAAARAIGLCPATAGGCGAGEAGPVALVLAALGALALAPGLRRARKG